MRPGPGGGKPVAGARSLGDPLLPQIGNGGYDVKHYRIYLDYDPGTNTFNSARTTIHARAQQTLKQFSLDFQGLDVSSVKELARRWYPRVYNGQPEKGMAHRALADIKESIRELAYYRSALMVPEQPELEAITAARREAEDRFPI